VSSAVPGQRWAGRPEDRLNNLDRHSSGDHDRAGIVPGVMESAHGRIAGDEFASLCRRERGTAWRTLSFDQRGEASERLVAGSALGA